MHHARGKLGLSGFCKQLVAVGGINDECTLSAVQTYSETKEQWAGQEDMKKVRERPGVCVCGNFDIYVFGGNAFYENSQQGSVQRKCGSSGWELLDVAFNCRLYHIAVTPYEGDIFVFGGYINNEEENKISGMFRKQKQKYEPLQAYWKRGPLLFHGGSFIKQGSEIFAVGYYKEKEIVYLFKNKMWSQIHSD